MFTVSYLFNPKLTVKNGNLAVLNQCCYLRQCFSKHSTLDVSTDMVLSVQIIAFLVVAYSLSYATGGNILNIHKTP